MCEWRRCLHFYLDLDLLAGSAGHDEHCDLLPDCSQLKSVQPEMLRSAISNLPEASYGLAVQQLLVAEYLARDNGCDADEMITACKVAVHAFAAAGASNSAPSARAQWLMAHALMQYRVSGLPNAATYKDVTQAVLGHLVEVVDVLSSLEAQPPTWWPDCIQASEEALSNERAHTRQDFRPRLVLMSSDDQRRCIFEHAASLREAGGSSAPLTLSSHPNCSVVTRHRPRQAGDVQYIELGLGPAASALHVTRDNRFLKFMCDTSMEQQLAVVGHVPDMGALDVHNILFKEDGEQQADDTAASGTGCTTMVLAAWGLKQAKTNYLVMMNRPTLCETLASGGDRHYDVNEDGTISPSEAHHLVVGCEFMELGDVCGAGFRAC